MMDTMKHQKYIQWFLIFWVGGIVVAEIFYFLENSSFSLDVLFALFILIVLFLIRKHLKSMTGIALIVAGLLMNASGIIGAYNINFWGLGWDKYLHIVSSAGIMLSLVDTYTHELRTSYKWKIFIYITCAMITLGMGGLNEINEFIGSQVFGQTGWIFAIQNVSWPLRFNDQFDVYFDLIFNAVGIAIGIFMSFFKKIQ